MLDALYGNDYFYFCSSNLKFQAETLQAESLENTIRVDLTDFEQSVSYSSQYLLYPWAISYSYYQYDIVYRLNNYKRPR